MTGTTRAPKRKRDKPNLGFELDAQLHDLITREKNLIPSKGKSQIIRDRLRQSYIDYPLPAEGTRV